MKRDKQIQLVKKNSKPYRMNANNYFSAKEPSCEHVQTYINIPLMILFQKRKKQGTKTILPVVAPDDGAGYLLLHIDRTVVPIVSVYTTAL